VFLAEGENQFHVGRQLWIAIGPIPTHDFDAMCENKAVFQSSRLRFIPTRPLGATARLHRTSRVFLQASESIRRVIIFGNARYTVTLTMRWILPGCLVIFASISAAAQTKASNPPPSYQGQRVGSIDLTANPHLDTEPYRELIVQKAGEPYSDQKIQESIAALNRSGVFSKVELKVQPDPSGLKLTFVLQPAYYIGMLKFPGGTKHFSYSRLLQVVNLPDQTEFQQTQVATAEAALTKFFHDYGFFLMKVHTDVQLDDANRLAHITFQIEPGKHAHVGKVEVRGAKPEENRRLQGTIQSLRARLTGALLKHGKPYSPRRIQAATTLVRKKLAQQNYPANKIVIGSPDYHPDTNLADLAINVDTGPVIEIRVVGAKLSWIPFLASREKKKLISIYDEESIDPDIIEESRRNLQDYFERKGYFEVKVNTNSQQQNDRTILTFQINKGRKYSVKEIAFTGNHHLSSSDLAAQVEVKEGKWIIKHGTYSAKLTKQSAKNIENFYKDNGFEQVKVTPQAVTNNQGIRITFNVVEGERTTVGNLRVEGNKNIPFGQLHHGKGQFELLEGKPFSPRRMADDRNQIAAKYLDAGFLNSEVKTVVTRHPDDPHVVDVTYAIAENQRVRISHVVYMGWDHTRLALVKKSANLDPEQPLSQGKLLQGESDLYDLGIFDWSSIGPRRQITDQAEEEALVKVHEAKRNSITYGFGLQVSKRGGNVPTGSVAVPGLPTIGLHGAKVLPSEATFVSPRGSVEYRRLDMRGLGESLAVSVLAERLDQRFITTYTDPHFRLSNWQALTSISAERTTENPLFQARLADASIQFQRFLNIKKTRQLQLRYDFNHTKLSQLLVPQLVLPADRNVQLSYVSSTLIQDTRDKPLDAHHGVYSTIDLRIVPSAFGSTTNFTRLLSQYAFYKPLGSLVFANSIRLGLAAPFAGSNVPTSQRFFAGGGTTLRGFPTDEAGPVRYVPFCQGTSTTNCPLIPIPVGGNQLFILNSELRYPLPLISNLGGVIFYDGGNVYRRINFPEFVNNYSNTVGIGLRYNTPIGPLRIDLGHNLNPVTGISATQFFITLGQAF
jgi:outer membrane protein insertion porin family